MNKYKLYMIMGIILLVLSITGSLAYYFWKSSSDTLLSGNLCLPEISFTGGATINGKLKPVASKEEGLIKEVEVNLHKTCNNDTAVMNLYLSLDLLPVGLQENTFIYELYNGNNERISSGNFSDKKEGDTITLAENEIVTSDVSIYTLYIYIDGNRDNPITMSNKSFRFNIYGEGTGAIYKENVIKNETTTPSSSSSTFLNTEVLRNEIESITIEKSNVVPNDAKYSKDISSKQDGSVILWYTDKDNNNLYEVSIGSENGVVEANTNGSGMFAHLDNVESLDLTGLDTSNMTSMSNMFSSASLKSINLSSFNTLKVTNMGNMFYGCKSLEDLDLSSFNTSNLSSMSNMFNGCESLKSLNLSNFDVSNLKGLTALHQTFNGCSNLKTLNLTGWKVPSGVTSLYATFNNCSSLTSLDLSTWDTSGVTNMYGTFYNCNSLKTLNLDGWDTSKVTTMQQMFYGCTSFETLDLSMFITPALKNMSLMFNACTSLKKINLSNVTFDNEVDIGGIFLGCKALEEIDIRKADFSNAKYPTTGYVPFLSVPNNVKIIVKDDTIKSWFNTNFSNFTNVVVN